MALALAEPSDLVQCLLDYEGALMIEHAVQSQRRALCVEVALLEAWWLLEFAVVLVALVAF